jgi:hypothetical protein
LNTTGSYNHAVVFQALYDNTIGQNNTAIGYRGLLSNVDGSYNTAIGSSSGLSNTSGSYNTFLGSGTDTSGTTWSNSTAIGVNAKITASNQITLGTSTETVFVPGILVASGQITAANFNATSDYRIKDNIYPLSTCSFEIGQLNPVTYHNKVTDRTDIGFIAHELQAHLPFLVTGEKDGDEIQTVNYNGLIGLLVHEIQQLKKNIIPKLNSFVDAPKADLIYRGSVQLTNGFAQVNLDKQFNMTDGDFAALTRDITVFTSNVTGWEPVRGSVTGNMLTIECQDGTVNPIVSYMVAAKPNDCV